MTVLVVYFQLGVEDTVVLDNGEDQLMSGYEDIPLKTMKSLKNNN